MTRPDYCGESLPWCERAVPGQHLLCKGDCMHDHCKNDAYELLTQEYWCDKPGACVAGAGRICVQRGRRAEVPCPGEGKCRMQVDVNVANLGLTINQALSLLQAVSRRPCDFFYCREALDHVLATLAPAGRTRDAAMAGVAVVATWIVLSLVRDLVSTARFVGGIGLRRLAR